MNSPLYYPSVNWLIYDLDPWAQAASRGNKPRETIIERKSSHNARRTKARKRGRVEIPKTKKHFFSSFALKFIRSKKKINKSQLDMGITLELSSKIFSSRREWDDRWGNNKTQHLSLISKKRKLTNFTFHPHYACFFVSFRFGADLKRIISLWATIRAEDEKRIIFPWCLICMQIWL